MQPHATLYSARLASPLGEILLQATEQALCGLYFSDQPDSPLSGAAPGNKALDPAAGSVNGRELRGFKVEPACAAQDLLSALPPNAVLGALPPAGFGAELRFVEQNTPKAAVALLQRAALELDGYWAGSLRVFGVPLQPAGTAFQQRIWQSLLRLEYGTTTSYGELARMAEMGSGYGRAAGSAVGSNPISIIIPCHRVLASNRRLNGYGGGLWRKMRLLQLEGLLIS